MQISIEESGAIERKLTIVVPAQEIKREVDKQLKDAARNARIPGFRPGKAPQNIIKKRYEPQITNEVISKAINSSYRDALTQEKIVPAGLLSIDPTPYQQGKDLSYVATIEVYPKIAAATLQGRTITKPVVEVTDEDVARTLDDIRARHADYVTKDGAAEKHDKLTIDFIGKIDGEEFAGGSATDFEFILGQGQMLKEFDTALLDCKQGDDKIIAFTFAQDYGNDEVAGKDVEFVVAVKTVTKPVLPELDDAFAESLGITEGGIEKMKQEIESNLKREMETRIRATIRNNVMNALYASNDIQIPQALIDEETDRAVEIISKRLQEKSLPTDKIDRNLYAEEAKKRVALGLIAREIIEKSAISADEATVHAKVTELSQSYEDSEAFVNWNMSNPEQRKQIEAVVIEEQIVDKMLETATLEEVRMSFKDFMNPQPVTS